MVSELLSLPGAVAASGADAGVAAHYGSFNVEQRTLASGEGFVDLSHREVVRIAGPDRLTWLHSLTSQHLESLPAGVWTDALILSPQGHIEHFFSGVDDGEAFTAWTEPGHGEALVTFLERMKFWSDVTISAEPDLAVVWRPVSAGSTSGGTTSFIPRTSLRAYVDAAGPACGLWAYEALRIERGEPRFFVDTDHRTIPNEVGLVGTHLDKGCYRGQETVARVHTLGRPPRRLVLLHLDGSENRLPAAGTPLLTEAGKEVGFVGTSARHFELGPIALGLVKRSVPVDAQLSVDGMPAAQEVVVDPDVGLHVRPLR
ncbi:CAF17-like 4Fe-4S cluster assembly/insertion protein YgfZ [Nocardioides nematodiphilus]|uniref:CAF17-like 4Fe-4S cluster assembly/insertion protein YgfZ n=1 Tax=Nocardioides nematodiphilus TaxID=2849669 RepID=UPI001CD9CEF7|nr:folate-binding protein [Nocardioides nematodiphilus]MCA1983439.1 folate-binding protein [Nocardioides nematodiphilus]